MDKRRFEMKITYAKCQEFEEGDTFPYCIEKFEGYYNCTNDLYECWQPNCLDDEEFNLVIIIQGVPVRVRGCHFDFVDKEL